MPDLIAAAADLRTAFAAYIADPETATRNAVHEHVCAYVDAAKASGWAAEHVIVAIKEHAHASGWTSSARATAAPSSAANTLLRDAIQWCIAHYYREV